MPKTAKRSAKYWKKKCDVLWSELIRAKGCCEICGRTDRQLHDHHLISRSPVFFRHKLNNGVCLCSRCHEYDYGQCDNEDIPEAISAHATPWAFEAWMKTHKASQYKWWSKNRHQIITGVKINYEQVYSTLKEHGG